MPPARARKPGLLNRQFGFPGATGKQKIRRLLLSLIKTKQSAGFFLVPQNKQTEVLPNKTPRKIHFYPKSAALPFGQTCFRPRPQTRAPFFIITNPNPPVNINDILNDIYDCPPKSGFQGFALGANLLYLYPAGGCSYQALQARPNGAFGSLKSR